MINFTVSVYQVVVLSFIGADLPEQGSCSAFQCRPFLSMQQTNQKQITWSYLMKLKSD